MKRAFMQPIGLLQFHPVLKRIRWGGRRLGTVLGKPIGEETDYAESWEVSCHENGLSVIAAGAFDGLTLKELIHQRPDTVLGGRRSSDRFPLLVKFLDANDRLSVQVHPDDAHAARFQPGANGKTEAWVVLDATPGSLLYVGLKPGVDERRLRKSLAGDALEDCLHSVTVAAGDVVFIPAGTVHAIGEGILLAEIQQSSDITFRLYDWGRLGTDGKPRPLHIEQAISCIDFDRGPVDPVSPRILSEGDPRSELLVESPYFVLRRHTAARRFSLTAADRFRVLMVLQGSVEVAAASDRRNLPRGGTVLVPACCPAVEILPRESERAVILEAFVPDGA